MKLHENDCLKTRFANKGQAPELKEKNSIQKNFWATASLISDYHFFFNCDIAQVILYYLFRIIATVFVLFYINRDIAN